MMHMDSPVHNPVHDHLMREIRDFAKELDRSRLRHRRQEMVLVSATIVLSSAVTLSGLIWTDKAIIGSVLGVFLSAVLAIERAFAFGERAIYSRILQAEAENLADDESLAPDQRLKKFADLRLRRAQAKVGEGVHAIESNENSK
jgi:hypothetical protein